GTGSAPQSRSYRIGLIPYHSGEPPGGRLMQRLPVAPHLSAAQARAQYRAWAPKGQRLAARCPDQRALVATAHTSALRSAERAAENPPTPLRHIVRFTGVFWCEMVSFG